jgi:glutathionyl-hydroquinone reductase
MKNLNSLFSILGHNITAEFYPYADIKHTIRRRNGRIYMRISDVFCDAPEEVLLSLGRILLAKLNKKRINQKDRARYSEYVTSEVVQEKASHSIVTRKRKTKIIHITNAGFSRNPRRAA